MDLLGKSEAPGHCGNSHGQFANRDHYRSYLNRKSIRIEFYNPSSTEIHYDNMPDFLHNILRMNGGLVKQIKGFIFLEMND